MTDTHQIPTCPNCGNDPKNGLYCPNCGQKNKPTKLNLGTIFGELLSIVFNIDNQFFRTLKAALIPGKLATEFGKGKRKTYLHPLRFFFYSWVLFALMLQWSIKPNSGKPDRDKFFQQLVTVKIDSTNIEANKAGIDSIKSLITGKDFNLKFGIGTDFWFVTDSTKLKPKTDSVIYILSSDLKLLSKDSLYQKYAITNWIDKFKIDRAKRIDDGFGDIFQYMMEHFIWLFFAVIPFSALWLWLLFGRSKKYYAEHILYLLYLFGVLFLFFSMALLIDYLPNTASNVSIVILWFLLILYSYFSLKNYYGQGGFKTFIKWSTYLLVNFLLFLIFGVFFSIISAALF